MINQNSNIIQEKSVAKQFAAIKRETLSP